jgi:hypothetical protein
MHLKWRRSWNVTQIPRGAFIPLDSIRILTGTGPAPGRGKPAVRLRHAAAAAATARSAAARVITDGTTERIAPPPPVQRQAVIEETRKQEDALTRELFRFNFIRTVLRTDET